MVIKKIDTHSTFRHWFLLISNKLLLIVIDCYWLLIIIDWYRRVLSDDHLLLHYLEDYKFLLWGHFFSRSPFFRSQLPRAWNRLPAIGMAQTGLCKFAMNIVDFFLSQINRRMFFEENATAVGNFSTLSAEFWRQYLSCSDMSVATIGWSGKVPKKCLRKRTTAVVMIAFSAGRPRTWPKMWSSWSKLNLAKRLLVLTRKKTVNQS